MKKDNRKYERVIPAGNVYAALGLNYEKVGKLIDLSLGGLGFEYITNGHQSAEFSRIDIFQVGDVFNLHNLPCKIVYDIPLPPARSGIESLKHSNNRRCGVKFKTMSKEKNDQLVLFLESQTIID